MLRTEEVARHFALQPDTIRRRIRKGDIPAVRVRADYRVSWEAVWACEQGPVPRGARRSRYQVPLLTKADLAGASGYSIRTVERWIAEGLPTRNVFGKVRMNRDDARDWLRARLGLDLPVEAFLADAP